MNDDEKTRWTQDERDVIVSLENYGETRKEVAESMGISIYMVDKLKKQAWAKRRLRSKLIAEGKITPRGNDKLIRGLFGPNTRVGKG